MNVQSTDLVFTLQTALNSVNNQFFTSDITPHEALFIVSLFKERFRVVVVTTPECQYRGPEMSRMLVVNAAVTRPITILRQDPDLLLFMPNLNEEWEQLGADAAMTGHVVLQLT